MPGWPASTSRCANRCRPAAPTATTTSPTSARLSGVTELHRPRGVIPSRWRRSRPRSGPDWRCPPAPSWLGSVRDGRPAGRLTLVEGAGGLLVELGADGVTLRDLAVDLAAPVLVVVAPGLGTLNHTALTLEALAAQDIPCAGLVIGAWPAGPGRRDGQPRGAGRLAPLRAVLPAGAGALSRDEFEALSAAAFDSAVGREPGGLNGPLRRAALRRRTPRRRSGSIWDGADRGRGAQSGASRPATGRTSR